MTHATLTHSRTYSSTGSSSCHARCQPDHQPHRKHLLCKKCTQQPFWRASVLLKAEKGLTFQESPDWRQLFLCLPISHHKRDTVFMFAITKTKGLCCKWILIQYPNYAKSWYQTQQSNNELRVVMETKCKRFYRSTRIQTQWLLCADKSTCESAHNNNAPINMNECRTMWWFRRQHFLMTQQRNLPKGVTWPVCQVKKGFIKGCFMNLLDRISAV